MSGSYPSGAHELNASMGSELIDGPHAGSRVLPLEGGRNFRDLGGYPAQDGRRVKWGRIFRSGSMAGLTPADFDYLSELQIKTICDLRTTIERQSQPNKWCEIAGITYWTREYEAGFGEIRKLLASDLATPADAHAAMITGYQQLPFEQAVAYKELFARLAAGEAPLVFNCSAGKDRAGTAAALILSALGVSRDLIVEDYMLTEKILEKDFFTQSAHGQKGRLSNHSHGIAAAILRAEPGYLNAALDAIETEHGSIAEYLRARLGVSEDALRAIQQGFLE